MFAGVLDLLGGAYLSYLGYRHLISIRQTQAALVSADKLKDEAESSSKDLGYMWRRSFLVAISNPKALIFFSSVFPAFLEGLEVDSAMGFLIPVTAKRYNVNIKDYSSLPQVNLYRGC